MLQELPGIEELTKAAAQSWIKEVAEETRRAYEETESLKAMLKAKGYWWDKALRTPCFKLWTCFVFSAANDMHKKESFRWYKKQKWKKGKSTRQGLESIFGSAKLNLSISCPSKLDVLQGNWMCLGRTLSSCFERPAQAVQLWKWAVNFQKQVLLEELV